MLFTWDAGKDRSNRSKHGISFVMAARVFGDVRAVSFPDRELDGETRWNTIGCASGVHVVLTVAHTVSELGTEETIRIISARKATSAERRQYDESSEKFHDVRTTE